MLSANIPHLYIRNGIYYYRNNSVWKSLRTRCKKEAFRKVSHILFGTTTAISANSKQISPNNTPSTTKLIKAYFAENGSRWCAREYTRIKNSLKFLPKGVITREKAIELKASILRVKTVTTFNRSSHGFMLNLMGGLVAYYLKENKPTLNISDLEMNTIFKA